MQGVSKNQNEKCQRAIFHFGTLKNTACVELLLYQDHKVTLKQEASFECPASLTIPDNFHQPFPVWDVYTSPPPTRSPNYH